MHITHPHSDGSIFIIRNLLYNLCNGIPSHIELHIPSIQYIQYFSKWNNMMHENIRDKI